MNYIIITKKKWEKNNFKILNKKIKILKKIKKKNKNLKKNKKKKN